MILRRLKVKSQTSKEVHCKHDNKIKQENTAKKTTAIRVYFEKAESGGSRLVYEDDCVGISARNKLKLFTEGSSRGSSTGLGLFLIRKMMDVYGWQIQETGEPGKGSKFVITSPKVSQRGKENYQIAQCALVNLP